MQIYPGLGTENLIRNFNLTFYVRKINDSFLYTCTIIRQLQQFSTFVTDKESLTFLVDNLDQN